MRLPSAHASPDSIVDQKLGRALRTSPLLLSWLLRSHPKLPISMWFNGAASNPSDASNGSSETRSLDSRALPSNLADATSTDCGGHWWWIPNREDPLPMSEGSRRLGGRLSSLRAPIAHAAFPFLAGSKRKTPVRADSYIYSHNRIRAISAGRAAHNDQSYEGSWGCVPEPKRVYARVQCGRTCVRALMGPTADAARIVRGAVSPRFKYWLTQVGFKRAWEREEGLHWSGFYQVIVCEPRAAFSQGRFSQAATSGGEERRLFSMMSTYHGRDTLRPRSRTAWNTPRLRWEPTTSRPIRAADWYSTKSVVMFS